MLLCHCVVVSLCCLFCWSCSTDPKPVKQDIVIPLIKDNNWRLPREAEQPSSEDKPLWQDATGEKTLEQQAAEAIISS